MIELHLGAYGGLLPGREQTGEYVQDLIANEPVYSHLKFPQTSQIAETRVYFIREDDHRVTTLIIISFIKPSLLFYPVYFARRPCPIAAASTVAKQV